ncbi:uracil permease [Clostridium amylolyticum]|uniref:Uracil permease n=1 Tax=Clostridium amylolyticum TaxID=1121298 RepID=A0A1M6AZB9_9CLOT|nr:uracil-xanthine permease family protein [Clostridium amylolyticum]SHI41854.1 uracil permease [Clostridium amylolyticum]
MQQNVAINTEEKQVNLILVKVKRYVLALQHLIAMFGATVLVPMVTGLNPSVALFTAGIGTLIFHLCTKGKVPVFLGSSFAFIPGILAVKQAYNGDLAYAQGGMAVAGLVYVGVSFLIKKIGMDKIKAILPDHVVGPMIMVIGLNLIPVAIDMSSNNFIIAAITLGIALTITFTAKGFLKQVAILIAVTVGYFISFQMGLIDTAVIKEAPVFAIPAFSLPKFDGAAIMIIVPAVLAVFMEHIGDITTNGKVCGQNFIEDPGLNRTLLGDGLATAVASLIGGPANTTYGENTGVLALTKNYDPSILRITAVFAIMLGFIAKFGGVLRTIPTPVMGGISLMLFSMIALIGVKTIKDNKVKFNATNIFIMATILIIGIGGPYIEKATGITVGIPLSETVKINGLSFAAIVGITLNGIVSLISKKTKTA